MDRGARGAAAELDAGSGGSPPGGAAHAPGARRGGRSGRDTAPTGRPLVVAFAAVAITFTAALVIAQRLVVRIRAASDEITTSTSPSITSLSAMRSDLRLLEVRLDEQVSACRAQGHCGQALRTVELLRSQLATEWASYRALTSAPEEQALWREVDQRLTALDQAIDDTRAALAVGQADTAGDALEQRLKPACDRLDDAVARVTAFNHEEGVGIAADIDALARRSVRLAVLLGALSLAFTAVAATLSIRSVRRSQALLRRRAEELDLFAGRVAHDVLSPLNNTALALRLAARDASPEACALLERGERGLRQVEETVQALLAFARAGARPDPGASAEVGEVLQRVVELARPAAEAGGVALSLEPAPPARVACDAGVLVSMVANLVQNAVKHMAARDERRVRIRAAPERGRIRVEVEDTGPGISAEVGARIFEPFVRGPDARSPGSGLGLATAHRLAVAHGGAIGFRSRPGQGTLFWLELPRAR